MNIVVAVSSIFADLLVVLVTWTKTFRQVKSAATLGLRVDMSTTLLRDGTKLLIATRFEI